MKAFQELVDIIDALLGPNGCPWDLKQTLQSMRGCLLEETCEVIDAIDANDNVHIEEELGDLLFNVLFLCKLAEKEQRSTFERPFEGISAKLIHRHPHIFGNVGNIKTAEDVLNQWESIKKSESGKTHRKSIFDGIPKSLPSLARAQKMMKKLKKQGAKIPENDIPNLEINDEAELGDVLLKIVTQGLHKGLDAEAALRSALAQLEQSHSQAS